MFLTLCNLQTPYSWPSAISKVRSSDVSALSPRTLVRHRLLANKESSLADSAWKNSEKDRRTIFQFGSASFRKELSSLGRWIYGGAPWMTACNRHLLSQCPVRVHTPIWMNTYQLQKKCKIAEVFRSLVCGKSLQSSSVAMSVEHMTLIPDAGRQSECVIV